MNRLYDALARYQIYLLGLAIFLACLAVSFVKDGQGFRLILGQVPFLIVVFIISSLLIVWLYIFLDKRRIKTLSREIADFKYQERSQKFNLSELTDRQREVYEHIVSGKSNKEILAALYIEQSTLKSHINQIYKKLGVTSRKELTSR